MRQMTNAFKYLHGEKNLVHQDIKPGNILVKILPPSAEEFERDLKSMESEDMNPDFCGMDDIRALGEQIVSEKIVMMGGSEKGGDINEHNMKGLMGDQNEKMKLIGSPGKYVEKEKSGMNDLIHGMSNMKLSNMRLLSNDNHQNDHQNRQQKIMQQKIMVDKVDGFSRSDEDVDEFKKMDIKMTYANSSNTASKNTASKNTASSTGNISGNISIGKIPSPQQNGKVTVNKLGSDRKPSSNNFFKQKFQNLNQNFQQSFYQISPLEKSLMQNIFPQNTSKAISITNQIDSSSVSNQYQNSSSPSILPGPSSSLHFSESSTLSRSSPLSPQNDSLSSSSMKIVDSILEKCPLFHTKAQFRLQFLIADFGLTLPVQKAKERPCQRKVNL
jgi:hypothetical protein